MPIDLNDAGPQGLASIEQIDAHIDLGFEEFFGRWLHGLSMHFESDDNYDPRDYRQAFLDYCTAEFDRRLLRGPACPWPQTSKGSTP